MYILNILFIRRYGIC